MPVTYLIVFDVAEGKREAFLDRLDPVLDAMRCEATFIDAALHADPVNPLRFMLHETWDSHEDVMTVQVHRPYRDAWRAALPDLLESARDISMWTPLRSDGRRTELAL